MTDCLTCGGSGEIHWLANPPDPQTEQDAVCPDCDGEGVIDVEDVTT